MTRISIVIPTWNRPDFLGKAFRGISAQVLQPHEVIVSVRKDDTATHDWLTKHRDEFPFRVRNTELTVPGVVASMQEGVNISTGEIVCLLDDDAEPLADWLKHIAESFDDRAELGGLGGRDLLMYLNEEERNIGLTETVGILKWFGKAYGNHHIGKGGFRYVTSLKGCNCAFRGDLIRKIGFDSVLRGSDTQTHWETSLCLSVILEGYKIGYDPSIQVMHYVAPRHGPDQNFRGGLSLEEIFNQAHNEAYVYHRKYIGYRKYTHHVYALLIGSLAYPGIIQWIRLLLKRAPHTNQRLKLTVQGYLAGLKTARTLRKAISR